MNRVTMLTAIIAVFVLLTAGLLLAQEMPEGFQELYQEYIAISQQLQSTHQMVMQDPVIIEESEEFSSFIDQKLKDLSPEVSALVDERNQIINDIEAARETNNYDTENGLQPRFQELNQELQPYIYDILEIEEVQVRQTALDELFMQKMIEIDPETDQKIERLEVITEQLQKMME